MVGVCRVLFGIYFYWDSILGVFGIWYGVSGFAESAYFKVPKNVNSDAEKKGNCFLTSTQNGGFHVCFVRLPLLDGLRPILKF